MGSDKGKFHHIFGKVLLVIILCLLVLPMLQGSFRFIRSKDLDGYFELTPKPEFTWEGWLGGVFQEQLMKNREDVAGFRSDFVRLYNQVDYSLFRVPHAERVIIGKNQMFFVWNYIMAWLGKGMIGERFIEQKVEEMKFLQEYLWSKKKIFFLVIFPPEKPYSYPENIPGRYAHLKKVRGNYEYYAETCRKYGVNAINCNRWFMSMKDTSRYPLFPWNGTHWSDYGAYIAADSAIKFIGTKLGRSVPLLKTDRIEISGIPRHFDDDIVKTMNLIWDVKSHDLAYPSYHADFDRTSEKPSALLLVTAISGGGRTRD